MNCNLKRIRQRKNAISLYPNITMLIWLLMITRIARVVTCTLEQPRPTKKLFACIQFFVLHSALNVFAFIIAVNSIKAKMEASYIADGVAKVNYHTNLFFIQIHFYDRATKLNESYEYRWRGVLLRYLPICILPEVHFT